MLMVINFVSYMMMEKEITLYILECAGNKRKAITNESGVPAKQQKTIYPAYFIPELAHVVAMCDEKLPFVCLAQELSKRQIPHSGLQIEANATSLVLKLLSLPQPNTQPPTSENRVSINNVLLENKYMLNVFTLFSWDLYH